MNNEFNAWYEKYGRIIEQDINAWLLLGNKLSPDESISDWVMGHFQSRSVEFIRKSEL